VFVLVFACYSDAVDGASHSLKLLSADLIASLLSEFYHTRQSQCTVQPAVEGASPTASGLMMLPRIVCQIIAAGIGRFGGNLSLLSAA